MNKFQIYSVSLIVLLIIMLAAYYYLINIYEIDFDVSPKQLYADNKSKVTISVIPLNALGGHALFRKAPADFKITEGKDLVSIVEKNTKSGFLILQAKERSGTVEVFIKSKFALLPSSVKIDIYPNYALANN